MMKHTILLTLLFAAFVRADAALPDAAFDELRAVIIQDAGRKKPLDSFAREAIRLITGRERYNDCDPMDVLCSMMFEPDAWRDVPLFTIKAELRAAVSIETGDPAAKLSYGAVSGNETFIRFAQAAQQKDADARSAADKDALTLYDRITVMEGLMTGWILRIVPDPDNPSKTWSVPGGSGADPREGALEGDRGVTTRLEQVKTAYIARTSADFAEASAALRSALQQAAPRVYEEEGLAVSRELHYNALKPFRKSWILYLVALLILLIASASRSRAAFIPGVIASVLGFGLHTYGFTLRCLIAGRPPVSNMYESVIWVAWGCLFFAFIFELVYRRGIFLSAALAVATIAMIMADQLPAILDPAISPLVPVLRDNFWLTVHVLTITLSYSAFALALGVGHVCLASYALNPEHANKPQVLGDFLYRVLQVGVLLLAAGTILGGVWASYAWERFWGWDPKEVWALVTLLCYIAVLHARMTGWVGYFGLAVSACIGFFSVLMAWYGVNFVLGKGLHSYGFGTGGFVYVLVYVAVDLLFVLAAAFLYQRRKASKA